MGSAQPGTTTRDRNLHKHHPKREGTTHSSSQRLWVWGGAPSHSLCAAPPAESEVPDVPSSDEPYDSRFAKWMVKNKVNLSAPFSLW